MTRRPATHSLAVLSLAAALSAVFSGGARAQDAAPGDVVPRPDLSAMEDAARRKVEDAQEEVSRLLAQPGTPPELVGEKLGGLGQILHAYKLLDAAEAAYTEAARRQPRDLRWPYLRGLARHARGDLEAAVADYETVLAERRDEATLVHRGNALLALGRVDAARETFARLGELVPGSAASHYGLGRVAVAAGDLDVAVAAFERALALQPRASVVHYPLAQAYRRLGRLEDAKEHLALRGDEPVAFPDPLGSQVANLATTTAYDVVLSLAREGEGVSEVDFLGFALSQLGQAPGAAEQLARDLLVRGGELSAFERSRLHYALGGLHVAAGRDEDAASAFATAVELLPETYDARIKLGNTLARLGRMEEATAAYTEAIARRPDDPAGYLKRAAAHAAGERLEEARADLERAAELDPASNEAALRLAALAEQLGDLADAEGRYRAALERQLTPQERAGAHLRLAAIAAQTNDFESALRELAEARESDPTAVAPRSATATLLAQLGRYAEAAAAYAEWAELSPENPAPRLARASALVFAGDAAAARAVLETAVADFPEHTRLRGLLARHLAAAEDRAQRDGPRAVDLARELYQERPEAETIETLAMALAEAGRFTEAVEWQKRLLRKVGEEAPDAERRRLEANLALYEAGQACCAAAG